MEIQDEPKRFPSLGPKLEKEGIWPYADAKISPTKRKVIESPTAKNKFGLNRDEIEYCAAEGNYTYIYYLRGTKELMARSLGVLCMVLELERPHRSFGVNPNYVRFRNEKGLVMESGKEIPVSRRVTIKNSHKPIL